MAKGRILFAGTCKDAERLKGLQIKLVDLKGAAMMYPGFTDAHAHLREVGERELPLNLDSAPYLAAALAAVKQYATTEPGSGLLFGRGWIETHWPETRCPIRRWPWPVSPGRRRCPTAIKPGMRADFTVFSKDLITVPEPEILQAQHF